MTPTLRTAILDALMERWREDSITKWGNKDTSPSVREQYASWLTQQEPSKRDHILSWLNRILPIAEPMIREDERNARKAVEDATIEQRRPVPSLPWEPHDGPPIMTPDEAIRLYREKRSEALSRTVMTDEQRAEYVGDSKPT